MPQRPTTAVAERVPASRLDARAILLGVVGVLLVVLLAWIVTRPAPDPMATPWSSACRARLR